MKQRDRLASGGTTQAPRPSAVPAAPQAPANAPDAAAPLAPLWEDLFRNIAPAQQRELLALAERQGALYPHQLPSGGNGSPVDPGRQLLTRLLAGRTEDLEPVRCTPVTLTDSELDAVQRSAVASALQTPDVCLLQGLPGTGKSRVVSEIVCQAAARGERVLLVAPTAPAIDRVLEAVGTRDVLCPVRCLDRDEVPEKLPPAIRALTFSERVRHLAEHARRQAAAEVQAGEQRCVRLRKDEAAAADLEELAERWLQLEAQARTLQERWEGVPAEIEAEVDRFEKGTGGEKARLAAALGESLLERRTERQRLDAQLAELAHADEDARAELEHLTSELEGLRPLVEAKRDHRWWTTAWWRATVQGGSTTHSAELESRREKLQSDLAERERQAAALRAARDQADAAYQAERTRQLEAEAARRRALLDDEKAALAQEQAIVQEKWQSLCEELTPDLERPAAKEPGAVRAAQAGWGRRREQAEESLTFARAWAGHLEQAADTLAERLPRLVNLVAATTTSLPQDKHFGDAAANGGAAPRVFDLLILEEGHLVTESEFLKLASRARRWLVVGEPMPDPDGAAPAGPASAAARGRRDGPRRPGPTRQARPAALRPGFFQRLWQHLHLPHVWVQEEDRLCCRLRPLPGDQRQWIETECVADFPDVELRILTPPQGRPMLGEVVFPARMSIAQAKQYIFQELEQLPLRSAAGDFRWQEEPDRLILHLAEPPNASPVPVELVPGVREWAGSAAAGANRDRPATAAWETCRVEFARSAGWQREQAEEWVRRHVEVRDLGRTVSLDVPHRARPGLDAWLADLLSDRDCPVPSRPVPAGGPDGAPAVEFVPVPPLEGDRRRHRGGRGPAEPAATLTRLRGGAGLELDLTDGRHRDRLPADLRPLLPADGLVNYLEAQAVVRALTALVADPALAASAARRGLSRPTVAVAALYRAQAELIRLLVRQTPALAAAAVDLQIGVPADFRQREAQVVLVSLTRSHTHRAVTFGDGAPTLALALTRARDHLLLFGDPGTLVRRTQWEGPVDHLDAAPAARERELIGRLVGYLQGQGSAAGVFHLREGNGS
jgi:hypothetical protein